MTPKEARRTDRERGVRASADLSFFSLFLLSLFSYDFKCFMPEDSNIAGFTIYADWGKASGTYEISIMFAYTASIVCSSPFRGCW
jgi:hypothetical protein